jgi:hypothetical protein
VLFYNYAKGYGTFLERPPKSLDIIKMLYTFINTSGEKLPPYLRLPEKAVAYSVAIKVSK